jgi:putative FmdB family regulatory protein
MPLYDFRCRSCAAEFEALVRPPAEAACPACAGTDLERLVTGFSFSVRANGLSKAARKSVQKQQAAQKRDQAAYQEESIQDSPPRSASWRAPTLPIHSR